MIVKAFSAGQKIRVFLPNLVFENFTKTGFATNNHHWTLLAVRITDEDGKPYFAGYFGLELFTGEPEEFARSLVQPATERGKSEMYFSIPHDQATQLAIYDGTRLKIDIVETTKPPPKFYNKIIVFKKSWQ